MRKSIIDAVERLARRAGLIVAPCWRASQIDEEFHMRRLLKYLDVDCVFDVGVNAGQYGEKLRRHFDFKGQILSFEPNPAVVPRLKANTARDAAWEVFPKALGSEKGQLPFQVYKDSTFGSLRSLAGPRHVRMLEQTIAVEVEVLGEHFRAYRDQFRFVRPFLKLDTQGFDIEVAKGAGEALREFLGIQTEVSFNPLYDGAPTFQEAMAFYEDHGFHLSRLVPIHDAHFPDLIEMDAILIRSQ